MKDDDKARVDHIDVNDPEALLEWCAMLCVLPGELMRAIEAVGAQPAHVTAHLFETGEDDVVGKR